jgi:hypothetical protein
MIPVFLEAAVRSLLVGLAVALGLRIFRVRNVLAQKAAWGLVLVSALVMPLLSPTVTQWPVLPPGINIFLPAHPMTLLEELQAHILSKGGSGRKPAPPPALNPEGNTSGIRQSGMPQAADAPQTTERPSASGQRAGTTEQNAFLNPGHGQKTQSAGSGRGVNISPGNVFLFFYCGITALFFMRIALGVVATIRLWRTATPIPSWQLPYDAACLQVRASSKIASPLTVGSAILLPADYSSWDTEKLRIVLAHERSHIRQGDFYLQLLASLYAAIVWFSPLGWWIKHQLAELAEAISDRAGMEEAASCTSYAQILLEFAAAPRRVRIGVAMARPGSLSRRIERLLNDNSFRQCFAGGRRALVGVALVPLAILSCAMLVHVQAATTSQSSPLILTGARTVAPSAVLTATEHPDALPASLALEANGESDQITASASDTDPESFATEPTAPAIRADGGDGTKAGGMQEGGSLSFDRTLTASGAAQLSVSTGSGSIHITRSSGNEIRVHGKIHVSEEGSEDEARQIAANPPIEQNGDSIRVGQQHQEHWHGISIDYQIEAPAGTQLSANSGSGEVIDEGVGKDAKLQTGSGDIRATGLEGAFTVKTGSGNIVAEQTGQGDVVAETGSGDIELKDIHGGFHGETGSGDIKANGTPSGSWTLQTGSGTIELWTGNAGVTLDASTGSGSVNSEHEMVVQGSFDHHHIHGTLNGGGPTIRVQTGSGDIRLH